MGRTLLICRLAVRDLRRRPTEAVLLLIAMTAATTTLTLGLVLHGVTSQPYQSTRAATAGPDVVANVAPLPFNGGQPADLAALEALTRAAGVIAHSGPYPLIDAMIGAHGDKAPVQAVGRDAGTATVDQPKLTQRHWVSSGGVVVERSFAEAFALRTGDPITLDGRSFRVVGIAVTAAEPGYPLMCLVPCTLGASEPQAGPVASHSPHPNPGLIWLTRADIRSLAPNKTSLSYLENLKLANPAAASAFVNEHSSDGLAAPTVESWQDIRQEDADLVTNEQRALLQGSWLLALLALASIVVLVGGRIAGQIRRVGLLKAVGGTPALIAAVLLAEYIVLALLAAAAGLAAGWLAAPMFTKTGADLIGSAGSVDLTPSTIALVAGVALAVAAVATLVPASAPPGSARCSRSPTPPAHPDGWAG